MSKVLRYPKEFGTTGPSVDYLEMQFIRRNYDSEKVDYMLEDVDGANTIFINIPQKVTEAISQQFNQTKLGELGAFLGKRSDAAGAVRDALTRTAEQFLLDKSVDVANKLGATNLSASGLLSATSGVVFNPNLEVLYEGPDFRTFNFQFNLFTKSKVDAEEIFKIVESLRKASLPRVSTIDDINTTQLKGVFTDTAAIGATTAGITTISKAIEGGLKGKFDSEKTALGGAGEGILGSISGFFDSGASAAGAAATAGGLLFNGGSRFIKQPPFILLTYKRGTDDHPFIKPLLPCAINQINFDFTPTGNYTTVGEFNADPKATTVGVTITMNLTEVTNLFADKMFTDRAPGVKEEKK
jgi:hypothetical protein|tara:strand:+ start:45 stop:1109 length:1065 start_codon:yes stop_codon:yes gene_type:complete